MNPIVELNYSYTDKQSNVLHQNKNVINYTAPLLFFPTLQAYIYISLRITESGLLMLNNLCNKFVAERSEKYWTL